MRHTYYCGTLVKQEDKFYNITELAWKECLVGEQIDLQIPKASFTFVFNWVNKLEDQTFLK